MTRAVDAAPAIEARGVRYRYRMAAAEALRGVDLVLPAGEWGLLIGPTGAGKSTLVRCLNRSIPAFFPGDLSGTLAIGGFDTRGAGVAAMAPRVGVVFQDFESQIFSMTCLQEVAFAMENRALPPDAIRSRARDLLARVGLSGFEDRDPATLSGGEKQRLVIAAVLALDAPLIVLDEPASDLDPGGREEVYRIVGEGTGGSILLVEHDLEGVPATGPATLLQQGTVTDGWPATDPGTLVDRAEALVRAGVRPPPTALLAARLREILRRSGIAATSFRPRDLSPESLHAALEEGWILDAGSAAESGTTTAAAPECVRCDHVRRVHGTRAGRVTALDDVSIGVRRGEMVALIGPNGSGKTTLAQLIAGVQRPDAGRVLVEGREPAALAARDRARLIGYVFQNPDHQIFCATVREEIAFGPTHLGLPDRERDRRVAEAIATVGLVGAEQEDPFALNRGERQRVALASVLAMEPALVIMDEPTTGLDHHEQERVMAVLAALKARGHTVLIITHALWLVHPPVDRVILLDRGRVAADGAPASVLTDPAALEAAGLRAPDLSRLARMRGVAWLTVDDWAARLRPAAGRG